MTAEAYLALGIWGVAVSLDLIAMLQIMITRPLVAGIVAGWLAGDIMAGVTVGMVLELFALEVLPFGAARYADYGIGAVAATAVAVGTPGVLGVGVGVGLGLAVAIAGETAIQTVRHLNSEDVRRHLSEIDAGNSAVIRAVHRRGLVREAAKAAVLSAGGLLGAFLLGSIGVVSVKGAVVAVIAVVGIGLANAVVAGIRLASASRSSLGWFGAGLAGGALLVMLA